MTSINSGLLKVLESLPLERIHNLEYDYKYLQQRAQNTDKESFENIKELRFPLLRLLRCNHPAPAMLS